jgi:hypothetical protein
VARSASSLVTSALNVLVPPARDPGGVHGGNLAGRPANGARPNPHGFGKQALLDTQVKGGSRVAGLALHFTAADDGEVRY